MVRPFKNWRKSGEEGVGIWANDKSLRNSESEFIQTNYLRQRLSDNLWVTIWSFNFPWIFHWRFKCENWVLKASSHGQFTDCGLPKLAGNSVVSLTAKSAHMGSSFTTPVPVHLLPKWQFSYCQGDSLKKSPGKFYFFLKLSSNMIGFCNICKALTALSLKYKNPLSHTVASFWTADWQIGSEWTAHCHLAVGELRMWRGLQESWFRCDSMWL